MPVIEDFIKRCPKCRSMVLGNLALIADDCGGLTEEQVNFVIDLLIREHELH